MKLLVDECRSQRVALLLSSNGHDAVHVLDVAADDIAAGAIVVITDTRIRITALPMNDRER